VRFYEEVRVWMAKFDAEDRQSRGEPIPEEIQRLLGKLIAESTASGDVVDIYDAAGMPKPTLTDLNPDFVAKTQQARNPHLAIEALRKLLNEESTKATRNNVVRQRAFSERLTELMNRYTNQQLTSAEVIAELVELAREVAAEARRRWASTSWRSLTQSRRTSRRSRSRVRVSSRTSPGAGVGDAPRRADRLDGARRRAGQAALVDQAAARQARLPAGQAARRDQAGARADGVHGPSVRSRPSAGGWCPGPRMTVAPISRPGR